jgi:hypothetical protein
LLGTIPVSRSRNLFPDVAFTFQDYRGTTHIKTKEARHVQEGGKISREKAERLVGLAAAPDVASSSMRLVLNMEPAAWSGKPIVYKVLNLPESLDISIKKYRYDETWCIVRGGRGQELVKEGQYSSAEDTLEVLRKEFPA